MILLDILTTFLLMACMFMMGLSLYKIFVELPADLKRNEQVYKMRLSWIEMLKEDFTSDQKIEILRFLDETTYHEMLDRRKKLDDYDFELKVRLSRI